MKITAKVDGKRIREFIYAFLKDKGVKSMIKYILKATAIGGGIKAWIVKELVEYFYEEIGEPVAKAILAKGGYVLAKVDGAIIVNKIDEAKNENNQADYDSSMDDLLN